MRLVLTSYKIFASFNERMLDLSVRQLNLERKPRKPEDEVSSTINATNVNELIEVFVGWKIVRAITNRSEFQKYTNISRLLLEELLG